MTDELKFDDWWTDFSYKFRNHKDSGFAMLERLIFDVRTFSQQKRIAFIEELLEREKLQYYACQLIPLFGDQRQVSELKNKASKLVDHDLVEDILPAYFEAIIKLNTPDDLPLLTKYYLNYQDNWFLRIPTELYHINKDLFLKAFAKKLPNYPTDRMCEYDGLLYLTADVEALEYLILNLPDTLSDKLKKFALAKSKHSMVVHDEKLKQQLLNLAGQ